MLLVDTDVLVDFTKGFESSVAWLQSIRETEVLAISGFTAFELVEGCENKRQLTTMRRFLQGFTVFWLGPDGCIAALDLFADHSLGNGLDLCDSLIAQTALEHDLVLLTFNARHFRAVKGLKIRAPYNRTRNSSSPSSNE